MFKRQKIEFKAIDLSGILRPYENKWVALSNDYKEILASGTSLKEVTQKCKKKNCVKPIYFKVLPFDTAYAPFF